MSSHPHAPLRLQPSPPGGYFIGTVPDGKRVGAHLSKEAAVDLPMLRLVRKWEVRRWGNRLAAGRLQATAPARSAPAHTL